MGVQHCIEKDEPSLRHKWKMQPWHEGFTGDPTWAEQCGVLTLACPGSLQNCQANMAAFKLTRRAHIGRAFKYTFRCMEV